MPAGAGREDCQRQPAGQDERERTSQILKSGKVKVGKRKESHKAPDDGERRKNFEMNSEKTSLDQPLCLVIAGPNGAGKSTFAKQYLYSERGIDYCINADLIGSSRNFVAGWRVP